MCRCCSSISQISTWASMLATSYAVSPICRKKTCNYYLMCGMGVEVGVVTHRNIPSPFLNIILTILNTIIYHVSLVPRPHPLMGKRVWHSSSHFLFLLTRQFSILGYQSDCRHVIVSCENDPHIVQYWYYSIALFNVIHAHAALAEAATVNCVCLAGRHSRNHA